MGLMLVVSISSSLLAHHINVSEKQSASVLSNRLEHVAKHLTAFEQERSREDLDYGKPSELQFAHEAIYPLRIPGMDQDIPAKEARDQQARMYLRCLAAIDRHMNRSYDRDDPRTDPNLIHRMYIESDESDRIADPVLRAKEHALWKQRTREVRERFFQNELSYQDQFISSHAGYFFVRFFSPSAEDQAELNKLLDESGISAERKTKIKAFHFKEPITIMFNQLEQVAKHLTAFEQRSSREDFRYDSLDDLRLANRSLNGTEFPGTYKDIPAKEAREQQAKMHLRLLATVDRHIDRRYDHNHPSFDKILPSKIWGRIPPRESIQPQERAAYDASVKERDRKSKEYFFQSELRDMERSISWAAEHFFPRFYKPSAEDQAELNKLLDQSEVSAARKAKIKGLDFKGVPPKSRHSIRTGTKPEH